MLTLIIISLAFFCLYYYFKNREFFELASRLPGPQGFALFRVAFDLMRHKPADIIPYVVEMHQKFGHVLKIMLGPHCVVLLSDPKDVEKVLLSPKCLQKSDQYKMLGDWLSTGLLTSTGPKWHSRRKIITPAFHFSILEQFVPTFEKHSTKFVEKLRESKMNCFFNISEPLMKCTLNVICETAMGLELNSQNNSDAPFVESMDE
jgi:cytochrome P450